jgi:parallel beta-helix repeat protein
MKTKINRKIGGWTSVVMIITVAFFVVVSPRASAGTPVGGYIDNDTLWTLRGSPFWVESDVIVRNGATLFIDNGVEVLFNGYYNIYIEVGAMLRIINFGDTRPALFSSNFSIKSIGDWRAIQFNDSSYDQSIIQNSIIEYASYGIRLESASPTIQNNTIRNCTYGIDSNNGCPMIDNNTIENCPEAGINVSGNDPGGGYTTIKNNTVYNNTNRGIVLYDVSNARLRNNSISDSNYNFGVWADTLAEFDHDIDEGNTVDQKPIYYWRNHEHDDETVPAVAGYVGIVNSTNITVGNTTVTYINLTNNGQGVLVAYSNYTRILKINASENELGTLLFSSSDNILENSIISNNDYNGYYSGASGIYLRSSSSNTIGNSTASSNNMNGISLYDSDDNEIRNNTLVSNKYGISFYQSSDDNIASYNTLTSNEISGIFLWKTGTEYNDVNNNTISNSDYGIHVDASYNNISYNNVLNCDNGIYIGVQNNYMNIVNNNNASNNCDGIIVSGSSYNTIRNNIANSNSHYGIYIHHELLTSSYSSQYNVIINNSVTGNGNYGILLENLEGPDYNTISNNTVSSNLAGIALTDTRNNDITYNTVDSNDYYGISLDNSLYNNVNNNDVNSNGDKGIRMVSSDYNKVKFNTVHNNEFGIYLSSSSTNNLSHSNISSNDYDGIYLTGDYPNDIFDNTITWNGHAGINCTSSSDPTIKSNDIENNTRNGVWSEGGSDPVINYNNICNNGGGAAGPGYGVINKDNRIDIDATNNWWNDPDGPGGAGPGDGDRVSPWVNYDPWSGTQF